MKNKSNIEKTSDSSVKKISRIFRKKHNICAYLHMFSMSKMSKLSKMSKMSNGMSNAMSNAVSNANMRKVVKCL